MSVRTIELILEAKDRSATRGIKGVRTQTQGLGGDLRGMSSMALRAGGALGIAFGAREVASFLLNTNRETERLKAQLRTFDGGRASAVFQDIQRFASETPFQIGEITEAYVRLRAIGLNPTEDTLRSFGDTSAAMGKDLIMFAEAVSDAATFEFERLKEFGIKASSQGDHVVFRFRGQAVSIEKDAQAIVAALEQIGKTEFAGGMAERMDTIDGAWSNLIDTLETGARTLGEAGINELIKDGLIEVTAFTASVIDNKAEIAAWVKVTVEGTGFAVEAFLLIPRVAIDSIQAMSAASVVASELVKRKVNFDIRMLNRLTGVVDRIFSKRDLSGLQIDELDITDLGAAFTASFDGVRDEVSQSVDRLQGLAGSWLDIVLAADAAYAAQTEAAAAAGNGLGGADGLGGGAGAGTGAAAVRSSRLGLSNTSAAMDAIFGLDKATPRFDEPLFGDPKPGPFSGAESAVFGFAGAGDPLLESRIALLGTLADVSESVAESYASDMERMRASTEFFADSVVQSVQFGVIDVFSKLGPALLGGLGDADAGMSAVGASIGKTLGDIMVNAGTTIVLTDKGFMALKASLMGLGTGGGIAAGLALIAAGSAMRSAVGSFVSNPTGRGGAGGSGFTARDFNQSSGSSGQGRVEITLPAGSRTYDYTDPRQREELKRFIQSLVGSREIEFVVGG